VVYLPTYAIAVAWRIILVVMVSTTPMVMMMIWSECWWRKVEEEVDQVNCRVINGCGLPAVPPLDSEVYSRVIAGGDGRGGVNKYDRSGLVGMVAGEAGSQQTEGAGGSFLVLYKGYGQPLGDVYCCPGCGANMHPFCDISIGAEDHE